MDSSQIKHYWEQRAGADATAQSTTQDIYLREIESRVLHEALEKYRPARVMDIGCGDARTTIRVAGAFPATAFLAGDYSDSMLRNAEVNLRVAKLNNVRLEQLDVTRPLSAEGLDLVYTTRCLINLPTWKMQQDALENIHAVLRPGGVYLMIENFVEGHDNFNHIREALGLAPIPVRTHNLYFERSKLLQFTASRFSLVEEANISSTYYLVSRIIYSRICQDRSVQPDYFDEHHRYASVLPFCGEYGPVRLLCLRRS